MGVRNDVAKIRADDLPSWLDAEMLAGKLSGAFSTVLGRAVSCKISRDEYKLKSRSSHTPVLNENFTFENFAVCPSNRLAHAAMTSCIEARTLKFNPVLVIAGEGLGKTHLLQALAHRLIGRRRVCFLSAESFSESVGKSQASYTAEVLKTDAGIVEALLFDDLHLLVEANTSREAFFNLFNNLLTKNRPIVITSALPPSRLSGFEERIVSRLLGGITVAIEPPSFETKLSIISMMAKRVNLTLDEEVSRHLADLLSNGKQIEEALTRLGIFARLTGKPTTTALLRELFGSNPYEDHAPAIDEIQAIVSEEYGISRSEMNGKTRRKTVAWPRMVAMYFARELTDYTLEEIGGLFGGRDHATVVHAHRRVGEMIMTDNSLRKRITAVRSRILDEKNRRTRSLK